MHFFIFVNLIKSKRYCNGTKIHTIGVYPKSNKEGKL